MTRSIAFIALDVCRVDMTRCPVSAAVREREVVSKSRISPTNITSGSSLKAALRALLKLLVFAPNSLWFIKLLFEL